MATWHGKAGVALAIVAGIGCGESGGSSAAGRGGSSSAAGGSAGDGGEAQSAGSPSGGADQSGGQNGEGGSGGDGAPSCTADLLTDAEHCGSCERGCAENATCSLGHCIEKLVDLSVWGMARDEEYIYAFGYYTSRDVYRIDPSTGQAELAITEENAGVGHDFTLDDDNFYFTTGANAYRAPKTGGAFELLGTLTNGTGDSSRAAIAADGTYVYWSGWEGILRAPAAGGDTEQWVTAGVSQMWLDGDTLWWGCRDFAGFSYRSISEPPTTEFSPTGVTSNATPEGFALDDTHIFFLDSFNPLGNYLGSVPREGGETISLVDVYGFASKLAVSGSFVFFANEDGQLVRVPKTGGPTTVQADFAEGVNHLFADGNYLYVGSDYALYRVTRD